MVEKIVDMQIEELKEDARMFRNEDFIKAMNIKNIDDFLFGSMWGSIFTRAGDLTARVFRQMPSIEQTNEVVTVVKRRLPEIRQAIFDLGSTAPNMSELVKVQF